MIDDEGSRVDAGRSRAWVRCYAALNDFLVSARRFTEFPIEFHVSPSVKDLVEGAGVPHTEIDLVLVNGEPVAFAHKVCNGDRVSVYPRFESIDVGSVTRVRPPQLHDIGFVVDTHLGRLARYLRLLGFDAHYESGATDGELARISVDEGRVLLTRDRGLLKRGEVIYGYAPRHVQPRAQLLEVVRRFDLEARLAPFTRCLECNGMLRPARPAEVAGRVPERLRRAGAHFRACDGCGRVYWEGSHHARLALLVDEVRRALRAPERPG
jgi:uncharacterized protein with PIN domain